LITPDRELVEKLSRVRLVLMDIDGTLVTGDNIEFGNVLNQLRKLRPLDIGFSIATGRTIAGAAFVTERLRELGRLLPPMITYNGAVVLSGSDNTLVSRHLIERGALDALIQAARKAGVCALAYACHAEFGFAPKETVYSEAHDAPRFDFNGMPVVQVADLLAVQDDFVAVLLDCPTLQTKESLILGLQADLGDRLRITTSGPRYIEICHPSGTKRSAMVELARMRKIHPENVMAIGDNYNDEDMIEGAGVGVAVANAPLAVQRVAALRTTLPSGQGVVQALRLLTRAVRSWRPPRTLAG